ncbi:MAG TPA: hypothetical protein VFS51_08335 [Gemmatimonadales bacterium]|nr:hypothetical protein [Gemmatimonadales bacterium]
MGRIEVADLPAEHMAVKEEQGTERLRLRRGADPPCRRQVRQEAVDLRLGHLQRMAFLVKEDVTADPVNVGALG